MKKEKVMKQYNVGVIGLGNRGHALLSSMMACPECKVVALSDLYEDRIEKASKLVEERQKDAPKAYLNWKDLVDSPKVEIVMIICDWEMHIPMSIYAMEKGKIVGSEVAGAYSVQDCWDLVDTYERTKTPIMMMENCCFDEFELLSTAVYRSGKLGELLYCHGCYSHDLREEILGGNVNRHYRLRNYQNRNAENYPTHELGPIAKALDINRGNRLTHLSSFGTRPGVNLERFEGDARCPDSTLNGTKFAQSDIVTTTLTTEKGQVITIRLDTSLPHFYAREFTLRGTKGFATADNKLIMTDGDIPEIYDTYDFYQKNQGCSDRYKEEFLPDVWKNITPEQRELGHGGMDYIEFRVFFDCLNEKKPFPIDVYDMATWMAVTPLSEESLRNGGTPIAIPDFTRGKYKERPSEDVIPLK